MTTWPFDTPAARRFTEARQAFLRWQLPDLLTGSRRMALDVGCGVGYFSGFLADLGYTVVGVDGRSGNVDEARRRYPHIDFRVADVESSALADLGRFDLVLAFGLLYHAENPFRAVRNLHAVTAGVLLVESICAPSRAPALLLRDEGTAADESLRQVAFYPSESAVVAMLYRAGFAHVYRPTEPPDHEDFRPKRVGRARTLAVASHAPLTARGLRPMPDLLWSVNAGTSFNQRVELAARGLGRWARAVASGAVAERRKERR